MNDRIYTNGAGKLRSEERIQRLELDKVVGSCLQNTTYLTMIDIGTGSGLFAEAFSNAGLIVSGIDLNEDMITAAKKYLPECDFKLAVAEDIPYDNNAFDVSFFGLVFHEVSDYKKALSEAFRVSKFKTFILEWKYKTENFGPPIEHRLKSKFIKSLSEEIGYKNFSEISQSNLVLFELGKV
jgi:ubiquinone/menaquinone biosynthesis C-methylase UbiE